MHSKIKSVQFDTVILENGERYRAIDATEQGKIFFLRPQLEADIRALADPHSQADAQLKTALAHTRLSAQAVRRALVAQKGWRFCSAAVSASCLDLKNNRSPVPWMRQSTSHVPDPFLCSGRRTMGQAFDSTPKIWQYFGSFINPQR